MSTILFAYSTFSSRIIKNCSEERKCKNHSTLSLVHSKSASTPIEMVYQQEPLQQDCHLIGIECCFGDRIFSNGGLGVDRFLSLVFPYLAIGIGLGLGLDDDAVLDWI